MADDFHDDAVALVAMAKRRGMDHDVMAASMIEPVAMQMLRIFPALVVAKAFEDAAAMARAKAKAVN